MKRFIIATDKHRFTQMNSILICVHLWLIYFPTASLAPARISAELRLRVSVPPW